MKRPWWWWFLRAALTGGDWPRQMPYMVLPRVIYWLDVNTYILDDGFYLYERSHWPITANLRGSFGRLWSRLFVKAPALPRLAGGIEFVARVGVKQYGFLVVSPEVWSEERGFECRSLDPFLPGDTPFYTFDMWDIKFPREPLLGLRPPYDPATVIRLAPSRIEGAFSQPPVGYR